MSTTLEMPIFPASVPSFQLYGLRINDHRLTCVVPMMTFYKLVTDPRLLQPKAGKSQPDLLDEIAINSRLQRHIEGAKQKNIPAFASYIREIVEGSRHGVLPQIHLWIEHNLQTNGNASAPAVIVNIPHNAQPYEVDGQTCTAALFELQRMLKREPRLDLLEKLNAMNIDVTIHHGLSLETARLFFHDLNVLGVNVNAAVSMSMNDEDSYVKIVTDLENTIPALRGKIERTTRQLSKDSEAYMSIQTLRTMVICVALGIKGVTYGSKPAPTDNVDFDRLLKFCRTFVTQFVATFDKELRTRDKSILSAPAVLGAVAAYVHEAYSSPESVELGARLAQLAKVNYNRPAWAGIGKTGKSGFVSMGGPKEASHNVYRALTDSSDVNFDVIRGKA